jgi:protein-disulfide isomerase
MNRRILILVTLAAAVAVAGFVWFVPSGASGSAAASAAGDDLALAEQPRLGAADAPVEVVVFEDFLCPHCGTFVENVAPRLKRDYVDGGDVAYYMKNFVVMGPESERVAQVGECVAEQGDAAFWRFEEVAFRAQDTLNEANAVALAERYVDDLDAGALQACIASGRGLEAAKADGERAVALGLRGTPSVVVNGAFVPAANYADVTAAIDDALADAR